MSIARGAALGAVAAVAVVAVGALAWVSATAGRVPSGSVAGGSGAAPTTGASSTPLPSAAPVTDATPTELGRDFLAEWVTGGRVIRRDQGGDTVSEGQAYGMLIAVGIGDKTSFDAIWSWTAQNLATSDGLLAWRWADGRIVDAQPAADADLDVARSLVLAGAKFDEPSLTAAGNALGGHILDRMTASTKDGLVLLPGPWAATASPVAYNPSYASPVAFSVLAASSGDPRWKQLETGSVAVTSTILADTALPPDWAQVHTDTGVVDDMPGAAGTGTDVRYSFDAARLPLRFAESCAVGDRQLAARLAAPLTTESPLQTSLDLGGGALAADSSPIAYAARAASLAAAGDDVSARRDLATAVRLSRATPTYYGAAWAALASLMLETDRLGGCPQLKENGS